MNNKKVYSSKKGSRASTSRPGRSRIRNRQPPNQSKLEGETESYSSSAKKMKMSQDDYDDVTINQSFSYRIIDFMTVFLAISTLVVCKKCGSDVQFYEKSCRGLGFKVSVCCKKCTPTDICSSPQINNKAYDINRRLVFVMRLLGIGYNGIQKFCAFMELPQPVFLKCYYKIIEGINIATTAVCEQSIKNAGVAEKLLTIENSITNGIIVSGDGSWRKRGFSSLFGIASLVGHYTGKVLDIIVKSAYCKCCEFWENKKGTAEYEEWSKSHTNCQINHVGSAGKMEVDAIIEMFARSENIHNQKYAFYVGDGDSKTFKGIVDSEPYDDIVVQKKECIGHVQKRMGTRLRALTKNTKGLGGKGKLTGKLIDELTLYYGLAIRRNHDSVEKMRNAIWATILHKISTDEKPQHEHCPAGEKSWCSWQQAKATGTLSDYRHKEPILQDVFNAIKPIYENLSRDDLLIRCLGGYTQNNNESLNAIVWSLAPKSRSSCKMVLDICTYIAVCTFNDGFKSLLKMMEVMNLTIGTRSYNFAESADNNRVNVAERRMSDAAKEVISKAKSLRHQAEEDALDIEGLLYGPGIAD